MMLPRRCFAVAVLALVLALVPAFVLAQAGGSGSIHGTVLDSSGATLPGATVVAMNVATGVETTRQATSAGVYVVSPLPPGEYRVTFSLDGFRSFVQEHVLVDALANVGLNATLQVGGVTQEVIVSAEPPQLRTADARLGQTIRNEIYTALPLVMNTGAPRDPTQFMFLMPGVQSIGRWGNVMGGQDFSNDTYVDGLPVTNSVVQGEGRSLSLGFSVEAIDQFQVETSGTAVMYNGQGASNYVVKSGTNTFRGSAFEFLRNKALDTKPFFAVTKPDDNQSEYGVTFGGPIVRNSMFFFVSYDGYKDRRQTPSSLVSVPTEAERRGDFSALPVVIYDPATTRPNPNGTGFVRDPFPGNIIPSDRLSPISQKLQAALPGTTNGGLQNNYLGGNFPIGFNNDNITSKVDLNLSPAHRTSVLFSYGSRRQTTAYRGGTNAQTFLPLPYTETRYVQETPTTAQVKHNWVMSPRWVNEFTVGFSRLSVPITNATIDGRWATQAGIVGLPPGEADSSFPEVAFAGPNAPTQWRGTDARAFTEFLNNYTLQDNAQWVRGKHAFTFGMQAQRLDANERERAYGSLSTFGFSNNQTAGFTPAGAINTATGNAYASFLLGELNTSNVIQDSQIATSGRFNSYSLWAQDDYRLSPKLTMNLGLRYDIMKPYVEVYDRWSFMNPDLPNPAVGNYPGALEFAGNGDDSCHCRTPIKTYYGNLGPRIGAAFTPSDRYVLRGSYGIMYTRRGAVGGRGGARNGTGTLGYSANSTFPSVNGFAPAFNWNNGIPSYPQAPFFNPGLNAGFATGLPSGGDVTYGDPEIGGRPPRYQNWNGGVQIALRHSLTVGISYAGSRGDFLGPASGPGRGFFSNQLDPKYLVLGNLLTQSATPANLAAAQAIVPGIGLPYATFNGTIAQMLRPFPQYNNVSDVYGDVAHSTYHSFQVTLEQRRWHGLLATVNYVYSRTEDDLAARTGHDRTIDWAVGANDQPHIFNAILVYDWKGWQVSGITQFRSGRPLGPILAACNLPSAGTCYADFNASFTGPVRINGDYGSGDVLGATPPSFIDKNAFVSPAAYTFGNTPRTLALGLRNPASFNQDVSLKHDFRLNGRWRIGVGAEVFNLFNNVVFGGIQTNITSANFGRVSSQVNGARAGQLKFRVDF